MYTFDRLPFWATFFAHLGVRPVLSRDTDKGIRENGVDMTVAEPCFPIRVAHGHVEALFHEGADYVFLPNVLNEETEFPEVNSHACPWGQTLPFVIRTAPRLERFRDRLLTPRVRFRLGAEQLERDLRPLAVELRRAARGSCARRWRRRRRAGGVPRLARRGRSQGARRPRGVGRARDRRSSGGPYNMYDKGVNMDIPRKLRTFYGVNVIPMDFLPLKGIDVRDVVENMYWNYGRKILQAGKFVGGHERLHIIYLTNFKCGPDSYIKHYIRAASGKPFLTLQFDEHQNDAGAMTRCEAYLDSKGFLRWWSQGDDERLPTRATPAAERAAGRAGTGVSAAAWSSTAHWW